MPAHRNGPVSSNVRPHELMTSKRRHIIAGLALLVSCIPSFAQDLQRGLRNYQDIVSGKKKLEQFSSQEQQEVLIVFRKIRASQSKTGKSDECRESTHRAESAASELADRARKLRNCAEAQDYSDDCDTEFRRVRNAHSDYESAVSSVRNECN